MSNEKVRIVVNMCDCDCVDAKRTCTGSSSSRSSSTTKPKKTTRKKTGGTASKGRTTPKLPPAPPQQYQEPIKTTQIRTNSTRKVRRKVSNGDLPVFMIPEASDRVRTARSNGDLPVFMTPEPSDRKKTTTRTSQPKKRTVKKAVQKEGLKWANQQINSPKTTKGRKSAKSTKLLPKTTTAKSSPKQLPSPEPKYIPAPETKTVYVNVPSEPIPALPRRESSTRNVSVTKSIVVDNTYRDQARLLRQQDKIERRNARIERKKQRKLERLARKESKRNKGDVTLYTEDDDSRKNAITQRASRKATEALPSPSVAQIPERTGTSTKSKSQKVQILDSKGNVVGVSDSVTVE